MADSNYEPGDRVYNRQPFFGPHMPPERKNPSRRGTVLRLTIDGWPWVLWDDGYEYAISPVSSKLRPISAVDELAELGRTRS